METVSKIRRWVLADGLSIREVSRRTGVSRNTVRKYLREDIAEPRYRQSGSRLSRRLLDYEVRLRSLYEADLQALAQNTEFRNTDVRRSVAKAGLAQRRSGLDGARVHLSRAATRMIDDFRISYPDARLRLRRNHHASNTLLRWRFTTDQNGKGDVQFSDKRISDALTQFDYEVARDWISFETHRLLLNHSMAMILFEQKRLVLLQSSTDTIRQLKREIRDQQTAER